VQRVKGDAGRLGIRLHVVALRPSAAVALLAEDLTDRGVHIASRSFAPCEAHQFHRAILGRMPFTVNSHWRARPSFSSTSAS